MVRVQHYARLGGEPGEIHCCMPCHVSLHRVLPWHDIRRQRVKILVDTERDNGVSRNDRGVSPSVLTRLFEAKVDRPSGDGTICAAQDAT